MYGEHPAAEQERHILTLALPASWTSDDDLTARCGKVVSNIYAAARTLALSAAASAARDGAPYDGGHYRLEGATIQPLEEHELVRDWIGGPVFVVLESGDYREALPEDLTLLGTISPAASALADARRAALEERWGLVLRPAEQASAEPALAGDAVHLAIVAECKLGRRTEAESRAKARVDATEDEPEVHRVALADLAAVWMELGRPEALPLLERLHREAQQAWGADDVRTGRAATTLGLARLQAGDLDGAVPVLREAVRALEDGGVARAGHSGRDLAAALYDLGLALERQHAIEEAEPLLRRALQSREAEHAPIERAQCLVAYGRTLARLGRAESVDVIARARDAVLGSVGIPSVAYAEWQWSRAWQEALHDRDAALAQFDGAMETLRAHVRHDDARLRWIASDRSMFAASSDAELEARWREVTDNWEQQSAHEAFVAVCHRQNRMREASMRYLALANEDPSRAPAAKERSLRAMPAPVQRIIARARAAPHASPRPLPMFTPRWSHVALVAIAAALVALWILTRR